MAAKSMRRSRNSDLSLSALQGEMSELSTGSAARVRRTSMMWPQADEVLTARATMWVDGVKLRCTWGLRWLCVEANVKCPVSFAIGQQFQIWLEPAGLIGGRPAFGWKGAHQTGDERVLLQQGIPDIVTGLLAASGDFLLVTLDGLIALIELGDGGAAGRLHLMAELCKRMQVAGVEAAG